MQAILKGKEVYLTGNPTEHPEIGEDSIEIIMNGGMLFLFGFGMPQVQHETSTSAIMRQLEDSDLQVGPGLLPAPSSAAVPLTREWVRRC